MRETESPWHLTHAIWRLAVIRDMQKALTLISCQVNVRQDKYLKQIKKLVFAVPKYASSSPWTRICIHGIKQAVHVYTKTITDIE